MSTQLIAEPELSMESAATQKPSPVAVLPAAQRPMFSQSFVVESTADHRRKRWVQASSFFVQSIILVVLIMIPLWFTDVLPVQQLATFLVAPPPPPPPPPPAAPAVKVAKVTEVVNGQLRTPSKIPEKVQMIKEEQAPPSMAGVIGGVEGGVPGGQVNGVLGALLPTTRSNGPGIPAPPPPKRVRVSTGISEGMLERKVEPIYPLIASRAHVQGTVQLKAIISKSGTIENLQLVSGHPLLVQAAMDAVKQWRYRPYLLNGEALEVETVVIVNFHIG